MKLLKNIALALTIFGLTMSTGCAATKVKRLDDGQEVALSDRWNAKDSELVAREMMEDMVGFSWVREWNMINDDRPSIIVQRISNLSHEHIAIDTFINELKRSIIRSGKADVDVMSLPGSSR